MTISTDCALSVGDGGGTGSGLLSLAASGTGNLNPALVTRTWTRRPGRRPAPGPDTPRLAAAAPPGGWHGGGSS